MSKAMRDERPWLDDWYDGDNDSVDNWDHAAGSRSCIGLGIPYGEQETKRDNLKHVKGDLQWEGS